MVDRGELEAKLAAIKRAYVAELPTRAEHLRAAWDRVQAEDWAQEPLHELHRLAHTLAGSGATFGFAALSADARALEVSLKAVLQDTSQNVISKDVIAQSRAAVPALYGTLLNALAAAAERGV